MTISRETGDVILVGSDQGSSHLQFFICDLSHLDKPTELLHSSRTGDAKLKQRPLLKLEAEFVRGLAGPTYIRSP